jgi:hypothetical protein
MVRSRRDGIGQLGSFCDSALPSKYTQQDEIYDEWHVSLRVCAGALPGQAGASAVKRGLRRYGPEGLLATGISSTGAGQTSPSAAPDEAVVADQHSPLERIAAMLQILPAVIVRDPNCAATCARTKTFRQLADSVSGERDLQLVRNALLRARYCAQRIRECLGGTDGASDVYLVKNVLSNPACSNATTPDATHQKAELWTWSFDANGRTSVGALPSARPKGERSQALDTLIRLFMLGLSVPLGQVGCAAPR